jgi:DUF1680 family protein
MESPRVSHSRTGTGTHTGDGNTVGCATEYRSNGAIGLTVEETPDDRPRALSLRIPHWCREFHVHCGTESSDRTDAPVADGWLRLRRVWAPRDQVVLELAPIPASPLPTRA